jgi:hypothetical protein
VTRSTSDRPFPRAAARWRFLLPLVLLVPAGSAAAAAPPQNLLRNPSAEEGTLLVPTGWDTTETGGLPTVRFAWDASGGHDGGHSLYVINTSDVLPFWFNWNQTLAGRNDLDGKDFILRAWVRTRQVSGKAYILLQAYRDTVLIEALKEGTPRVDKRREMGIKPTDDPQVELGHARVQVDGDHPDWTLLETRLYVPPSTDILIVRAGLLGIGEAWFDDFSLTAVPARPQPPFPLGKNLLADPGFEGNLNEWDFSLAPVEGLYIRPDAVAHSGLQSCLIECQEKSQIQLFSHVFQVFNTRALSGKRVRLSGWYKTEKLDNTYACFSIASSGMYGTYLPVIPAGSAWSGTNDWTFGSYEADIPADTYAVWVRAMLNTGPGKVWFDDLKFEVLGDTPRAGAAGKRAPPRGKPAGAKR